MKILRTTLMSAALLGTAASFAQTRNTAENSLIGIRLFDSGVRVVQVYGTPDDIQPVNFGQAAIGPAGGGGAGPGRGPGGGAGLAPEGAASGASAGATGPLSFEDGILFRQQAGSGANPAPPMPGGGPSTGPGGGGGSAGGGATQSSGLIKFTRWIYKRGGSRYGFILDNRNRVVQIEAIGLQNSRVRTRKGVGFGSTFADVIRKYNRPDGYEISGNQIVVRFLTANKVAFRLSRLGQDKPHVVTGVVVAAGN